MPDRDEIWYAAHATKVVFSPPRVLETFGQTNICYHVITELMDDVGQVRVRSGRVQSERPRVVMPRYVANQMLENFGEEAQQYVEAMMRSNDGMRVLEYGLSFRKEEYSEDVVAGIPEEIAEQVTDDVRDNERDLHGVLIGVDDLWEVSLMAFIQGLVQRSLPKNARDMAGRGLLEAGAGNVPNAVHIEFEAEFRTAAGSRTRLRELGAKLRRHGLFEAYEDRFYSLYRSAR